MPAALVTSVRQILPYLFHKQGDGLMEVPLTRCVTLGKSLLSRPWCPPCEVPVVTALPPGLAVRVRWDPACGMAYEPQRAGAGSEFWRRWGCPPGGICAGQPRPPRHLSSKWKIGASGDLVALQILLAFDLGPRSTDNAGSAGFRVWLPPLLMVPQE